MIQKYVEAASGQIKSLSDFFISWSKFFETSTDTWGKLDDSITKYGRSIGATRGELDLLRRDIIRINNESQLSLKYNIDDTALVGYIQRFKEATGRNVTVGLQQNLELIAATNKVIGENAAQSLFVGLDEFGVSISDSAKYTKRMYDTAIKSGINLQKYSENVARNLKIAAKYGFEDGIRGLEKMVKSSMALNMNISNATNVAEKILGSGDMISESAKMAAGLQALGGGFSQWDAMSILSNSILNVNGIQDMLSESLEDLTFFDSNTGEIQIGAQGRIKLRQAASLMNVSYDELLQGAERQGVKGFIKNQLDDAGITDASLRELIGNTAQLVNGVAHVEYGGKLFDLERIRDDEGLQKLIQKEYQFKKGNSDSDNIASIALDIRSIAEILDAVPKAKGAKFNKYFEFGRGNYEGRGMANHLKNLMESNTGQSSIGVYNSSGLTEGGSGLASRNETFQGRVNNSIDNAAIFRNFSSFIETLFGEALTYTSTMNIDNVIQGTTVAIGNFIDRLAAKQYKDAAKGIYNEVKVALVKGYKLFMDNLASTVAGFSEENLSDKKVSELKNDDNLTTGKILEELAKSCLGVNWDNNYQTGATTEEDEFIKALEEGVETVKKAGKVVEKAEGVVEKIEDAAEKVSEFLSYNEENTNQIIKRASDDASESSIYSPVTPTEETKLFASGNNHASIDVNVNMGDFKLEVETKDGQSSRIDLSSLIRSTEFQHAIVNLVKNNFPIDAMSRNNIYGNYA